MSKYQEWIARLGANACAGTPEDELAGFEKRTGLDLPDDMRQLYACADGMEIGTLRILPLDDVENLVDLLNTASGFEGCLPFTDRKDAHP